MLKLQYFGHLMQTAHSLKKTLMLRKTEGRGEWGDRGWASCIASPIQWNWIWTNSRRWWRTWKPGVLQSMGSQSWTGLGDWTNSPILKAKRWGEVLRINSVTLRPFIAYSHRHFCSFEGLAPHNQQPCLISFLPFIKFLVILLHLEKM